MNLDYIWLEGPAQFLDTVTETIVERIDESGPHFMGIVENTGQGAGGVGRGPHVTDNVSLHIRDGVNAQDAKAIINLALDQIADQNNMQAERQQVRLMYEDEEGIDQEL